MRRRGILVAVLLLAMVCTTAALTWPWDPLERARRRVPLGADESAVVAAVDREPDGGLGEADRDGEFRRHALYWQDGDDYLFVAFDADGRADRAEVKRSRTFPERVREWWPW